MIRRLTLCRLPGVAANFEEHEGFEGGPIVIRILDGDGLGFGQQAQPCQGGRLADALVDRQQAQSVDHVDQGSGFEVELVFVGAAFFRDDSPQQA